MNAVPVNEAMMARVILVIATPGFLEALVELSIVSVPAFMVSASLTTASTRVNARLNG